MGGVSSNSIPTKKTNTRNNWSVCSEPEQTTKEYNSTSLAKLSQPPCTSTGAKVRSSVLSCSGYYLVTGRQSPVLYKSMDLTCFGCRISRTNYGWNHGCYPLQMHGVSTINGSLHEFLEVALKLNGTLVILVPYSLSTFLYTWKMDKELRPIPTCLGCKCHCCWRIARVRWSNQCQSTLGDKAPWGWFDLHLLPARGTLLDVLHLATGQNMEPGNPFIYLYIYIDMFSPYCVEYLIQPAVLLSVW